MSHSSLDLRSRLVVWLYIVASAHLLGGVLLTWAGPSGLLDGYLTSIEHAFWTDTAPPSARAQQIWWMALFGATLQSYSLYMLALVHIGSRLKSPIPWAWLMAGILLWAPQDMLISMQARMWSHLWLDTFAMLALLPPLVWLYRHDRH
jgi:hypothetical protein